METTRETRPTVLDDAPHDDDRQQIEEIVADVEAGFNGNDPELSVEHFIRNAWVNNAVGVHLAGWEDLLEANRVGLAGALRDERARYRVADVMFLGPDLALAHKQAWATGPDGEDLSEDPAMVALYVLVKRDDRWWIAARANTLVGAAH